MGLLMSVTRSLAGIGGCLRARCAAGLAAGVLLLAGSLVIALLVTLAVAFGTERPGATAPAPA
jgi:hypothetical protein